MTKTILYKYLGTNGTIVSPVHLEDVYYVRLVKIMTAHGKTLTKDSKKLPNIVTAPEEEDDQWIDI